MPISILAAILGGLAAEGAAAAGLSALASGILAPLPHAAGSCAVSRRA